MIKRFLLIALLLFPVNPARAQIPPTVIRDTEIENTLKEWLAPLLQTAGMGENSVNLILVQSSEVNAFVAGGANIFVYTGLIDKTDRPEELIGVIAHELGHITGGHLIRGRDALERASYESILGTVVGIGVAALGGGSAGSAIMSGSSSLAQRGLLAHTRVNESSADQAALRFMEGAHVNPDGMRTFLEKLSGSELVPESQQIEYARTHPLSSSRIDALATRISKSAYKDTAAPAKWQEQHKRMKAKLTGFINPGRVLWAYGDSESSISARYARAIAAYRENDTAKALKEIDSLIAQEPENPYFQELKGQMLRDFGRVQESLPYYKKAIGILPSAGLIRIDYGHALLESGKGEASTREAITELNRALREEPRSGRIHRLLATAYGQLGQEGEAQLHLGEESALNRKLPQARQQAKQALTLLPEGSPSWIRAKDLLGQIDNMERKKD